MSTTDPAKLAGYADAIMKAVHEDISEEIESSSGRVMPKYPGSFSALHEYTDANMYLIDFVPQDGVPECTCPVNRNLQKYHSGDCLTQTPEYTEASERWVTVLNEVSDEVDKRLLAEYREALEQISELTGGMEFAADCTCERGAGHFHQMWPERGCISPRCEPGCQGYFR
jgi:hypothetical protein